MAQFDEYRQPFLEHLHLHKLFHWDPAIRHLSSKSLNVLVPLDRPYTETTIIPFLLGKCTSSELIVRHGALLGLGEAVLALRSSWDAAMLSKLAELVPTIEKLRLYRGRGGEIMRAAVCRFIECITLSNMTLSVKQQVRCAVWSQHCLRNLG